MAVTVHVPTPLRKLTGNQAELQIEAGTVGELVDNLESAHPGMKEKQPVIEALAAGTSDPPRTSGSRSAAPGTPTARSSGAPSARSPASSSSGSSRRSPARTGTVRVQECG